MPSVITLSGPGLGIPIYNAGTGLGIPIYNAGTGLTDSYDRDGQVLRDPAPVAPWVPGVLLGGAALVMGGLIFWGSRDRRPPLRKRPLRRRRSSRQNAWIYE